MKRVLLLALVLIVCACSTVPLTGRKQMLLVSDSEVLTASLTEYAQYIKTAPKSTNKTQTAMVERVGKKIAAATEAWLKMNGLSSEIANFSWEFNLIKSDEINAFCMPGGKIVVYEGLLALVKSDDDLGVVIGHEVAHAVAKHSNERLSQQIMAQYGSAIVDVALSNKSEAVQAVGSTVFGLGAQLGVMLPYSRTHELEADDLGLYFMAMAGYNPSAAIDFWTRMSQAGSGSTLEILSTHPSDSKRIENIKAKLPEAMKYYNAK